jgi:pimeloyl-ACP methyl ester carboxylesterase
MPDEVVAAYLAPFPEPEAMTAFQGMYSNIPRPGAEAKEVAAAFYDRLREDERPILIMWADSDLFLTLASGQRLASKIGRRIDHVLENCGHAVQEEQGPLVGRLIADWLRDVA